MNQGRPTYEEAVRLGWAIFWRAVGSFVLFLVGTNLLLLALWPELLRTSPPIWVTLMPFGVATLVCTLWIMPLLVIRSIVRTHFRGFHISFVRDGADPPPAAARSE